MTKIIFDIETSGRDWENFDEEQRKYLLKFSKTEEEIAGAKDQLALHAVTAEIVCIGLLNPDTNKGAVYYRAEKADKKEEFTENNILYSAGSETEILEKFWANVKNYRQFITFNGRGFDCPFLLIRSAILGVKATKNLMPYRYAANEHVDLLEQLTFHGAARKFNLDFYCKAFGIASPKSHGLNGHDVPAYFRAGKILAIAKYCAGDLYATKELYERWRKYMMA
ncbi:3'-5' exonuclease [Candidatus Falkowbacteria bacterium CG10_big_fil_rev_8_21_14_0_10_43_11]|uniref:3'-5' exonuclease n=1 Tax=Candidatus Falkowbacteria bacterium CG10_big_fil_rev_8_21_14_0_10_43_11 TaxID=1974568 RepID=A0A2M6WL22_9BACT|nr:MAG: 3'-5' exonuclease [Candidatus Falkowbacteria bacterium CG10_big_fil_rev_8_21_14_0_10_43_11]